MMRILVTGAGGFIGHHLVRRLRNMGHFVRGADLKFPDFGHTSADEFVVSDLREEKNCYNVTKRIDYVFNLAANMGGIGYITTNHALIACDNSLININMLRMSATNNVRRFLFSSSACVYPAGAQISADVKPLAEDMAIPAEPEPGYGWEKLYAEQLCTYFAKDFGMATRIVRFHNVYGPEGTYDGGKEKAPAALCRKIALAKDGDEIEVWGDGKQTRSFMYIDDCVEGLIRIMDSECYFPLNLGTDHLVSIDGLTDIIAEIAKKRIVKRHNLKGPQGVRGRNSDNSLLRKLFNWEPSITLETGLDATYKWIDNEVHGRHSANVLKWVSNG